MEKQEHKWSYIVEIDFKIIIKWWLNTLCTRTQSIVLINFSMTKCPEGANILFVELCSYAHKVYQYCRFLKTQWLSNAWVTQCSRCDKNLIGEHSNIEPQCSERYGKISLIVRKCLQTFHAEYRFMKPKIIVKMVEKTSIDACAPKIIVSILVVLVVVMDVSGRRCICLQSVSRDAFYKARTQMKAFQYGRHYNEPYPTASCMRKRA